MNNNRLAYIIIIFIAVSIAFITIDCNKEQGLRKNQNNNVMKTNYTFNPETYVDPYGTTTCYPSDRERVRKQRAKKTIDSRHSKGKYHYRVIVSDAHRDWKTYEKETMADGAVRLKKVSKDLSYINGTYEWDMDLYITNNDELISYIINNYDLLKNYKESEISTNIYDEYNNRLDEYLDDPEDEITFNPDIFNFLDD